MPPPCTVKYLYKIMKKKPRKHQSNSREGTTRSNPLSPQHRTATPIGSSFPAALYAKICRDPEILLFRQAGMHTTESSSTSFPKLPSQLPAVPPAQRIKQQEASRTQILFPTLQLGEEWIFPPCKLGGLKIVQAGGIASKLLESQDMSNSGVDTGFEAQDSPAEFSKSSSHLALLLSAGLAVPRLSCTG